MAVKGFKFASPGIFLNEIDQSQLPKESAPVGPIIIGRAQRGPAMRPVTVASYDEFVQTFGEPVAGGDSSGDVWRSGIPSGPTYGGYAAQAWLANNPTVTFVRLLGVQSDTATGTSNNGGQAGWTYGVNNNSAVAAGAYGLFTLPSITLGTTSSLLSSNAQGIAASAPAAGDTLTITLPTGYAGLAAPASYIITLTASLTPAASGNNLYISSTSNASCSSVICSTGCSSATCPSTGSSMISTVSTSTSSVSEPSTSMIPSVRMISSSTGVPPSVT